METPTQPPTKQYHIGDILSVSTGYFVGPTNFGAVHELIEFLCGYPIFTHQLIHLAEPCQREMLRQHPELADVEMSGVTPATLADRLVEQIARFGEYLPVAQVGPKLLEEIMVQP